MTEIKNSYVCVLNGSEPSYGGNQMCSPDKAIARCGCGGVAALDLLLYLDRYHCAESVPEFRAARQDGASLVLSNERYQILLKKLIRKYLPVIPPFGMNGVTLAAGVNLFFHRHKMPYRARWGVSGKRTWESAKEMLDKDIPVIMAVGPNFPFFWQNHKAAFYSETPDGGLHCAAQVKAHFVVLTGIDSELLKISSWGRIYYLKRREFEDYVRRYSINYFSSILYISRK